ncbi:MULTISPECIES: tyrosine-type recombinase/integrase [unclassified Paenibacillus]|uniref:tyrosine-type recombinase/integrase n=1 Tax=unclassified Paenibacillus TaxID=185978 RepID=UPI0036D35FA3
MSTAANIQRIGVESAFIDIESFLNQYESKNTRTEYRRDLLEYFQYMHGKDLSDLDKDDIIKTKNGAIINKTHAIEFRNFLIKKAKAKKSENYEGTINRKMSTVKGLHKFFQSIGYDVNYLNFDLKRLKYVPNSFDQLSKDQVVQLAEHVLQYTYGNELNAFIYLSTQTSFRVEVLVNSEKKNIKKSEKDSLYLITLIDKMKDKRTMGFEKWVYDKIEQCITDEKLFPNLTVDNVHNAITRAAKELGFEGRVTTHSLRGTALNYEIEVTGDIIQAMEQSGHKDIKTFKNHYVKTKKDFRNMAGIRMFRDINEEVFDLVNKEELLQILKECNKSAYEQLALRIQDMIGI